MDFAAGLEAFLGTVKLWLTSASDAEAQAVTRLVEAELRQRGLDPEPPATERKA